MLIYLFLLHNSSKTNVIILYYSHNVKKRQNRFKRVWFATHFSISFHCKITYLPMNCYLQLYKYIIIKYMDSKKHNPSSFIFFHLFKEIHLHHHYSIPNISISSSIILLFPFFINISIKNTNLVIFSFIQSFWTIYIFFFDLPHSPIKIILYLSCYWLYKMLLFLHYLLFYYFPPIPFITLLSLYLSNKCIL